MLTTARILRISRSRLVDVPKRGCRGGAPVFCRVRNPSISRLSTLRSKKLPPGWFSRIPVINWSEAFFVRTRWHPAAARAKCPRQDADDPPRQLFQIAAFDLGAGQAKESLR